MKKIFVVLFAVSALFLHGCDGPMGPMGPPGLDGEDGVNIVGEVFEVEADFTQEGNFGFTDSYGFDILESDKVLIYTLTGVDEDRDLWRLLPQTVFVDQGIFAYNYDFSTIDYSVFLEGDFDLNLLGPEFTDNQVFRVLIVPADRIDLRMDYSDHEAMLKRMDIDPSNIKRKHLN